MTPEIKAAEMLRHAAEVLDAIQIQPITHRGRCYVRVPDRTLGLMAQYELATHVRDLYDPAPITPDALAAMGFEHDGDWHRDVGGLTLYVSPSIELIELGVEILPWMNLGQLRRLLSVMEETNAS